MSQILSLLDTGHNKHRNSTFKKIGDYEFSIHLHKPYPPFLSFLTSPDFLIPRRDIKSSSDLIGSGEYEIDPTVRKNIYVFNRKTHNNRNAQKIVIQTFENLNEIRSALKNSKFDIALGIPSKNIISYVDQSNYEIVDGRILNPTQFHLNRNKAIFKDKAFRKDLKIIIQQYSNQWKQKNASSYLIFNPWILPRGFLPPTYYSENSDLLNAPDPLAFKSKWGKRIEKFGLTLWLNHVYTEDSYSGGLRELFKRMSSFVKFEDTPLIRESIRDNSFDLALGDGGAFYADPDSFLELWPEVFPPEFGFAGREILEKIRALRSTRDARRRLELYEKALSAFEADEAWIIPVFSSYDQIIKRKNISLPDGNFQPFRVPCAAKFEDVK